MTRSDRLLRLALRGNAAFSTLTGLAMLLASEVLAAWLGLAWPAVLPAVGAGLLLFAGALLWLASRPQVPLRLALGATLGDLGWVLGSAVLLLGWPELLSAAGQWAVGVVAALVLDFAVAQGVGLRRVVPD